MKEVETVNSIQRTFEADDKLLSIYPGFQFRLGKKINCKIINCGIIKKVYEGCPETM